jgi:hypothetical protein
LKSLPVLNKHFKNPEDAKTVVEQIEHIVEEKVEAKKDILLPKEDKIDLIKRMQDDKIELIEKCIGIRLKLLSGLLE